jgi:hypothetical protein
MIPLVIKEITSRKFVCPLNGLETRQTSSSSSRMDDLGQLTETNNDTATLPSVLKWKKNIILENGKFILRLTN